MSFAKPCSQKRGEINAVKAANSLLRISMAPSKPCWNGVKACDGRGFSQYSMAHLMYDLAMQNGPGLTSHNRRSRFNFAPSVAGAGDGFGDAGFTGGSSQKDVESSTSPITPSAINIFASSARPTTAAAPTSRSADLLFSEPFAHLRGSADRKAITRFLPDTQQPLAGKDPPHCPR
eukprot:s855_g10.t1